MKVIESNCFWFGLGVTLAFMFAGFVDAVFAQESDLILMDPQEPIVEESSNIITPEEPLTLIVLDEIGYKLNFDLYSDDKVSESPYEFKDLCPNEFYDCYESKCGYGYQEVVADEKTGLVSFIGYGCDAQNFTYEAYYPVSGTTSLPSFVR